ncbi:MAG: hypothetical protein F6K17_24625 [Okeania sp. SIO3C4]|nr:hypothetical protein [Okeania sp. SIO3B3]NER05543.1 hypothetical protein [Okeania sp. SIO3C4]
MQIKAEGSYAEGRRHPPYPPLKGGKQKGKLLMDSQRSPTPCVIATDN